MQQVGSYRRATHRADDQRPLFVVAKGCSHLLLVRVVSRVEGKGVADEVVVAAGVLTAVGQQKAEAPVGDVLRLPDEEGEVLLVVLLAARAATPAPVTLVGNQPLQRI